ncbi:hypothetical protein, partial [Pseudomonas amygdali]|uniref:hypothetical protein n=1 Tax=Pseudomonas amygdali TaxID=47877 RepID=UPI001CA4D860
GLLIFEIGQDCYANPQLLMTNRQSALGHFSIGRVGQFSISADTLLNKACSAGHTIESFRLSRRYRSMVTAKPRGGAWTP